MDESFENTTDTTETYLTTTEPVTMTIIDRTRIDFEDDGESQSEEDLFDEQIEELYINNYNHSLFGNTRIYGGATAEVGQFPFMVLIRSTIQGVTTYCGGAILSVAWVLTSAQCVSR
jgi:hypothetical protein